MNKIEELLAELCPEGVEYKRLGDIAEIYRGGNLQKKDFVDDGFPCIHYGQIYVNYNLFSANTISFISEGIAKKQKFADYGDIIMAVTSENIQDVCKCIAWLGKEKVAVSGHTAIIKHSLNAKFLVYLFNSAIFYSQKIKLAHGTKVIEVTPDHLKDIQIPVPPMAVQEEIVRILDKFTDLTADLTTELSLRKKQYEYYRDKLLTFSTDVEWITLGDCTEKTQNIKWKETDGDYRYIDLSSVDRELNAIGETAIINADSAPSRAQQIVRADDVLFGTTRPLLKRYCIIPQEYDNQIASTGFCVLRAKIDKMLPRYLYYVISTDAFYKYLEPLQIEGSYPSVTNSNVKAYVAPVPPLPVQERIVSVLDNFEAVCHDLKIGLPAEIEARKKQYEYYRDLLLTFPEKGAIFQTDRQTDRQNVIKLLQYVFGYAVVTLEEVAAYSLDRCKAKSVNADTYVGVDNLLSDKRGKVASSYVPYEGNLTKYLPGDILIGNIRPYLKKIWLADNEGGTNGDVLTIRAKDSSSVSSAYLYYVLSSEAFFAYAAANSKGGKMPRGDKKAVMMYSFCLPTLEKQKEIAAVLDRFDALCSDISRGLPAEIEARRKQYEYYRDKLLSFPRAELE